ncbi:MAG: protein kinase [Acidobacteria bacterium]|nr:protein kinase [Acidobacteriota bacterium]
MPLLSSLPEFQYYSIDRLLGEGGMGVVYLATDRRTDLQVAIKLISRRMRDAELLARFLRENAILSSLNHRNIVRCYEVTQSLDGIPALVMEYLDGVDMRAFEGRPFPELLPLMNQVLLGMEYLRSNGIVHRDVSSNNVLVILENQKRLAKIVDFGIAKLLEDSSRDASTQTQTGQFLGKFAFAAPEQFRSHEVTWQADVYSLGVVFFRLLTGRPPLQIERPNNYFEWMIAHSREHSLDFQAPPGCPPIPLPLQETIRSMLAPEPRDRPNSYQAIIDEISAHVTPGYEPPLALPSPVFSRPRGELPPVPDSAAAQLPEQPGNGVRSQTATAWHTPLPSQGKPHPRPSRRAEPVPPVSARPVYVDQMSRALMEVAPPTMLPAIPALRGLFSHVCGFMEVVAGSILRLRKIKLDGGERYTFFGLLLGPGASEHSLGTQTFMAHARDLESYLRLLEAEKQKVIVVVTDSYELGRGVREKILLYRKQYGALVVPLYLREVSTAWKAGGLEELVSERLADFHTAPDLYVGRGPAFDPTTFFGMRDALNQLVECLRNTSEPALLVVSGAPGCGKTSLTRMAMHELDSTPTFWLRCASLPHSVEEFVKALTGALRIRPPENPSLFTSVLYSRRSRELPTPSAPVGTSVRERLMDAVTDAIENNPEGRPLIVLEDADWLIDRLVSAEAGEQERAAAQEAWSHLVEESNAGRISIVVTCVRGFQLRLRVVGKWENPVSGAARFCDVPVLTPAAMKRMIGSLAVQMNVQFARDALEEVCFLSAGNLAIARQLCSRAVNESRRGVVEHSLAPVAVSRDGVRTAAAGLAAIGPTFEHTFLAWLSDTEKRVLGVIAARKPKSLRSLERHTPDSISTHELRNAVERLHLMGFVCRKEGRDRVTIPLLESWILQHGDLVGSPAMKARDLRLGALAAGMTLTLILLAVYLSWFRTARVMTPPSPGTCSYQVQFPQRASEGQDVTLFVFRTCRQAQPPEQLALVCQPGTVATANGPFTGRVPLMLEGPSRASAAAITMKLLASYRGGFRFSLEADGRVLQDLEIANDPSAVIKARFEDAMRIASALPLLIGLVVAFHQQMISAVRKGICALRGQDT